MGKNFQNFMSMGVVHGGGHHCSTQKWGKIFKTLCPWVLSMVVRTITARKNGEKFSKLYVHGCCPWWWAPLQHAKMGKNFQNFMSMGVVHGGAHHSSAQKWGKIFKTLCPWVLSMVVGTIAARKNGEKFSKLYVHGCCPWWCAP